MTTRQEATILNLTRKLNLGSRASDGIKAVLGKMPINMSEPRADSVIRELKERYAPIAKAAYEAEMQAEADADIWGGF